MFPKGITICIFILCNVILNANGGLQVQEYNNREMGVKPTVTKLISLSSSTPQQILQIAPTASPISFTVGLGQSLWWIEDVKINLVIKRLYCLQSEGRGEKLAIVGRNITFKLCAVVDNTKNDFQSVQYTFDGEKSFSVIPEGNEQTIEAEILVSFYIERSNCSQCPNTYFCCGSKKTSCSTEKSSLWKTEVGDKVRCIPTSSITTESPLCNGQPNCGFYCNADEQPSHCSSWYRSRQPVTVKRNGRPPGIWMAILFLAGCTLSLAVIIFAVSFMSYISINGGCVHFIRRLTVKRTCSTTSSANSAFVNDSGEHIGSGYI